MTAAAERYDPAAEMKARALAEIAEVVEASRPRGRATAAYRSSAPRAEARRELLRQLAEETRRRFMGEAA